MIRQKSFLKHFGCIVALKNWQGFRCTPSTEQSQPKSLATCYKLCYTYMEYILSVIHRGRGLSFSRLLGLLMNVVKNVNRHISIENYFFFDLLDIAIIAEAKGLND